MEANVELPAARNQPKKDVIHARLYDRSTTLPQQVDTISIKYTTKYQEQALRTANPLQRISRYFQYKIGFGKEERVFSDAETKVTNVGISSDIHFGDLSSCSAGDLPGQ